jgi:hypothetical protein
MLTRLGMVGGLETNNLPGNATQEAAAVGAKFHLDPREYQC